MRSLQKNEAFRAAVTRIADETVGESFGRQALTNSIVIGTGLLSQTNESIQSFPARLMFVGLAAGSMLLSALKAGEAH